MHEQYVCTGYVKFVDCFSLIILYKSKINCLKNGNDSKNVTIWMLSPNIKNC